MGGYMGFGMASWIYKQRPRKPFSMRRSKPTCNTLETYNREFKLQPSKKASKLYIYFVLIVIILASVGCYYKMPEFIAYSDNIYLQKQEKEIRLNNEAFNFLINSGVSRLRQDNLIGAYSEFKLAYNIYPKNEKLNQLLIETLSILCENNNSYCSDLDDILRKNSL